MDKLLLLFLGVSALKNIEYHYSRDKISEIIPNKLYISNLRTANNVDRLVKNNITDVLFINQRYKSRHVLDKYKQYGIRHKRYNIKDNRRDSISLIFEGAYNFIESGGKVLVHCKSGKSRAPTIVIMYLMVKYKFPYEKAYSYVKSKRNLIKPNPKFDQELQELEKNVKK